MANAPERLTSLEAGVFQERLRAELIAACSCWHRAEGTDLDAITWFTTLAAAVQAEAQDWQDALALCRFAFSDAPGDRSSAWAAEVLGRPEAGAVIGTALEVLQPDTLRSPEVANAFWREMRHLLRDSHGLRGRAVMDVLRAALTGQPRGPCLGIVGALLGFDRTQQRLEEQRGCSAPH